MKEAEKVPDNIACSLPMDLDGIVGLREQLKLILDQLENQTKDNFLK